MGISGITDLSPALSVDGPDDRIVYSAYHANLYSLWMIDDDEIKAGDRLDESLARVQSGVLPPVDRPVGDVMALLDNPTLGLPESTSGWERKDYSAGLSLDYIAPPQLAVGSDRFGTFVGGGTALFWSDILGRRNLVTLLQVNGGFRDIAAVVGYSNRRSRWNWGVTGGQIPIVTLGLRPRIERDSQGNTFFIEERIKFRQINREITGIVAYPFNRVRRMEFSARFRNIVFDSDIETITTSLNTGQILDESDRDLPSCDDVDPTVTLCDPSGLNLVTTTGALVYDNSFFGGSSPILGQRYRFEAAPTVGTLNFVGLLGDYRRYIMPIQPYTLAARVVHFGRYGNDSEDNRLQPLFIGYQQLMRGYNSGSFDTAECSSSEFDGTGIDGSQSFVGTSTCPVFDQLLGSRMLLANFELRFPLFRGFRLRQPSGFPPLELAFFLDAGVAWWSQGKATTIGGNRNLLNPVTSYGTTLRMNLFGAAIIQVDFVHPNNRPDKGWYFQFGLSPGF